MILRSGKRARDELSELSDDVLWTAEQEVESGVHRPRRSLLKFLRDRNITKKHAQNLANAKFWRDAEAHNATVSDHIPTDAKPPPCIDPDAMLEYDAPYSSMTACVSAPALTGPNGVVFYSIPSFGYAESVQGLWTGKVATDGIHLVCSTGETKTLPIRRRYLVPKHKLSSRASAGYLAKVLFNWPVDVMHLVHGYAEPERRFNVYLVL